MSEESRLTGPDFSHGVPLTDIADDGMLLGHAGGEPILLARTGREAFAVGAECTHYHGPLAEGLRIGTRCAAHGITPVSTCAPARRCTHRPSTRWLAGPTR